MGVKFQDYYAVLGVKRDSSPDEIRKAYRALARKHHPDVDKSPGATDRFKQINEAREVLEDAEKRKRYDALGARHKEGEDFTPPPEWESFTFEGAGPGGGYRTFKFGEFGDGGFSPFFEMFFGRSQGAPFGSRESPFESPGARGGVDWERRTERRPRVGSSYEAKLVIDLEDAWRGATRTITLESESGPKTYDVKIPPGTTNGSTIRLRGQGAPGSGGGPAGDLLLHVELAPHPRFAVDGHDLSTVVPITASEGALGAKVPVRTLDGSEAVVAVPPGSSSGKKLRLRGLGMPRRGAERSGKESGRGDLIVELRIVVPESLSEAEKKAYEELGRVSRFDPRK